VNLITYYCYKELDFKCCCSCHDEWDEGYGEPFETEGKGYITIGCCVFYEYIEEKLKQSDSTKEKT